MRSGTILPTLRIVQELVYSSINSIRNTEYRTPCLFTMTRRDLARSVDDAESQNRDQDVSDGFSEQSSTLPSYEDVVGDTPASAVGGSKGSDGTIVSET